MATTDVGVAERKEVQAVMVRLPREVHEALKERAREEDRSMSQAIRVAVRRYLAEPTSV